MMALAFHVACPITSKRICFCSLGFPQKIQTEKSKNGFLEEVSGVEELFNDLWSVRPKESSTVQVIVPRVVPPVVVPPVAATVQVGEVVGNGEGYGGGGDGEELLSLHSKRTELQKRAVAASIAAEDYVRKFETGALSMPGNGGETVCDSVGENQGIKVMCRICFDGENEGSEKANRMLPCKLCNKKYHRSCLRTWGQNRDLFHLSSWVCPSCRTCELCRKAGDPTKFMFCRRCDGAYHCYCLQPPHKNVSSGPYLCPKHTKCHSCGSNAPGNGPSTRWFLGYTCCDACGRLFVKGNYCPVCLKVYRDSESTPMVCCDECQRWVHCQCDGISDEKYLQFQVDGNLQYNCAACRGDCYQVTNPDDAVQELWRRRDKADHDQIAILRASAGLPPEEAFSASMYSDDEPYSPDESGRSLKISVKGSAHKGIKNTKEYGNKFSNKKSGKKKGNLYSLMGRADAHQHYGRHDRRSIEFNLTDEKDDVGMYKNEGTNILSSSSARSLANTKEKCSINQAGIMKHDFVEEVVAYNEDRPPIAHIKSSKSHGPAVGFGFGKNPSKMENVKGKKLVIHLGSRNKNVSHSPRSEASGCHREPDATAPNGGEDAPQQKVSKKHAVERNDGIHDGKGEKSGKTEQLKYSRSREGSLIKLGKVKAEVVSEVKSQTGISESTTRAVTLKTEEAPLKRHSDPKPLLKLKFKNPYIDSRSSWVPQGEEKSCIKGQRSKRKKPEKNQVREEEEDEEEEDEEVQQNSPPVNEVMDANWVLKKLGKDAIGKRVEIRQASDSSWHKGDVTDMIEGTSTIVVGLDAGGSRTLELGKQAIRFVSQKQKRSKT